MRVAPCFHSRSRSSQSREQTPRAPRRKKISRHVAVLDSMGGAGVPVSHSWREILAQSECCGPSLCAHCPRSVALAAVPNIPHPCACPAARRARPGVSHRLLEVPQLLPCATHRLRRLWRWAVPLAGCRLTRWQSSGAGEGSWRRLRRSCQCRCVPAARPRAAHPPARAVRADPSLSPAARPRERGSACSSAPAAAGSGRVHVLFAA